VFKNLTEWRKSEVAESDFYINCSINSTDFLEIRGDKIRCISPKFGKIKKIVNPAPAWVNDAAAQLRAVPVTDARNMNSVFVLEE
jgi:hypothetical protein